MHRYTFRGNRLIIIILHIIPAIKFKGCGYEKLICHSTKRMHVPQNTLKERTERERGETVRERERVASPELVVFQGSVW